MDTSAEFRKQLLEAMRSASEGTNEDKQKLLELTAHGISHLADFDHQTRLLVEEVGMLLVRQITEGLNAIPGVTRTADSPT